MAQPRQPFQVMYRLFFSAALLLTTNLLVQASLTDTLSFQDRKRLVVEFARLLSNHASSSLGIVGQLQHEVRVDTLTGLKIYICPTQLTVGDVSRYDLEIIKTRRIATNRFWYDYTNPLTWYCVDFTKPATLRDLHVSQNKGHSFVLTIAKSYTGIVNKDKNGYIMVKPKSLKLIFDDELNRRIANYPLLRERLASLLEQLTGIVPTALNSPGEATSVHLNLN